MSDWPQTLAADGSLYALWPLAPDCPTYNIYIVYICIYTELQWYHDAPRSSSSVVCIAVQASAALMHLHTERTSMRDLHLASQTCKISIRWKSIRSCILKQADLRGASWYVVSQENA